MKLSTAICCFVAVVNGLPCEEMEEMHISFLEDHTIRLNGAFAKLLNDRIVTSNRGGVRLGAAVQEYMSKLMEFDFSNDRMYNTIKPLTDKHLRCNYPIQGVYPENPTALAVKNSSVRWMQDYMRQVKFAFSNIGKLCIVQEAAIKGLVALEDTRACDDLDTADGYSVVGDLKQFVDSLEEHFVYTALLDGRTILEIAHKFVLDTEAKTVQERRLASMPKQGGWDYLLGNDDGMFPADDDKVQAAYSGSIEEFAEFMQSSGNSARGMVKWMRESGSLTTIRQPDEAQVLILRNGEFSEPILEGFVQFKGSFVEAAEPSAAKKQSPKLRGRDAVRRRRRRNRNRNQLRKS